MDVPDVEQWTPGRPPLRAPRRPRSRYLLLVIVAVLALLVAECGGSRRLPPTGPDGLSSGSPVTGRPRPLNTDYSRVSDLSRRLPERGIAGTDVVLETISTPELQSVDPGSAPDDCVNRGSLRPGLNHTADEVNSAAVGDRRPGRVPVTVAVLSGLEDFSVALDIDAYVQLCSSYVVRTGPVDEAEVKVTPLGRNPPGYLEERVYRETATSTGSGSPPQLTQTMVTGSAGVTLLVVIGPAASIPADLPELVYAPAIRALVSR